MSDQHIMSALQKHLALFATSQGVKVANEGVPFTPDATKTHLAEFLLPANTANPSMGRNHSRYLGIYQVNVEAPSPGNPVTLRKMANDLASHFPRGLAMTNNGQTVLITHTPSIGPLLPDTSRMKRPVSIRYQCDLITN